MNEGIKVLLVDDDIMTLRIISTTLSRIGYTVFTSQTAVDICNTVLRYMPHIVLMDYDMPLVSGIEAIGLLKTNDLCRDIPIIFFSMHANAAQKGIDAGAAMYVSKGSTPERLSVCINSLVNINLEQSSPIAKESLGGDAGQE